MSERLTKSRSYSSKKVGSILFFAFIGFLMVLSVTLYSSVIILAGPIPCMLLLMYKDETQMSTSIWRLAEETMFLSGFFLLLVAWFFLGFRGNPGFELLYSYSIPLVIVGSLLSLTGFLSWTERRRNVS